MTLQDKHISIYPLRSIYPDSDGKPMADNTLQAHWIVSVYDNLKGKYAHRQQEVFVAADLLWYPVEGDPKTRVAPGVLVVLDRPEGYRGSYRQWQENDVPLTVVFEVISPSNSSKEMLKKKAFYEKYGVSEFIILDPEQGTFTAYVAEEGKLKEISPVASSWRSPRLGIEVRVEASELIIFHEDGTPFKTFAELQAEKEEALAEKDEAVAEKDQAIEQKDRAIEEKEQSGS